MFNAICSPGKEIQLLCIEGLLIMSLPASKTKILSLARKILHCVMAGLSFHLHFVPSLPFSQAQTFISSYVTTLLSLPQLQPHTALNLESPLFPQAQVPLFLSLPPTPLPGLRSTFQALSNAFPSNTMRAGSMFALPLIIFQC